MKALFSFLLVIFTLQVTAQPLQRVTPEQVGLDSRRLMYADEVIETAIANKNIPGAVLTVVRNGKIAYLKAYGNKRTVPNAEPMTTSSIFDMASCSKPMSTAVCTMILAEQGKLRMLDPVSLYIPNFKSWESEDGKQKQTIRIADLMTHSSGLPPYAPTADLEKKYGSPSPDGLMEYIATCKRDFKPQTDFQYSCLNFITLQHIIEKVSGQSLRDFARIHLFDVLGMNHTDYLPCQRDKNGQWVNTSLPCWADANAQLSTITTQLKNIAPTEKQLNGQILCGQVHDPLARVLNGGISGNAGVFSCAEDIALLCVALQNGGEWNGHRILSPQGVKAMRTVPRATATLGRTLGWDIFTAYASNSGDLFGPNTYGHTGYTGTSIIIDPDSDTSVILLTNAVHPTDGHSVVRLRSLVANAVAASIVENKKEEIKKEESGYALIPKGNFSFFTPHSSVKSDHYYKRFLQFMDEPAITGTNIVMLGNSLTEGGQDWGKLLHTKEVCNRGISGDNVMGVYNRLHQILPGNPAKLFLMIGVNDISQDATTDNLVKNIRLTVERIQQESPTTKLYLQSLLPINESFGRWKKLEGKTDMIPQINAQLEVLAKEKRITFVNLFPLFTEKGTNVLRSSLTNDGLHLKEEGYQIWAKELKRKL